MVKDVDKDGLMDDFEDDSVDLDGGEDLNFEDGEEDLILDDEEDLIPSVLYKGITKPKTEDDWRQLLLEASADGVPEYRMEDTYKEGDLILHPVFGLGVVSKVITAKKMEVVYDTTKKLMAMNVQPPAAH
ncbi:hypothetical protein SAMN02746041_02136 [Desulfacinum hydrothermale DSM 13146]|uniref:Uncharacterized protein n=1 Tax=Desulfacinum hydrothermale DSM 13146 TaxID=1121390 RepID=A0A1W1XM26_9BACT|nr:hypothetical protein [Desulfacinum hydrothermale]SMC24894.1 hypothetical protein SAMN02746041_02136 [Desulfacinum hydrothermale DSM 13146]